MRKRKTMVSRRKELLSALDRATHAARESGIRFGMRCADASKWDKHLFRHQEDHFYSEACRAQGECVRVFNAAVAAARGAA